MHGYPAIRDTLFLLLAMVTPQQLAVQNYCFFLNFQVSAAGLYILLLLFFELYLICHLMHWVGSLLLPFLPLSNLPRLQLGVGLLVG